MIRISQLKIREVEAKFHTLQSMPASKNALSQGMISEYRNNATEIFAAMLS